MPYYLYKIASSDCRELIRQLELLEVYDDFKSARDEAKRLRGEQPLEGASYKAMFADTQLAARKSCWKNARNPC